MCYMAHSSNSWGKMCHICGQNMYTVNSLSDFSANKQTKVNTDELKNMKSNNKIKCWTYSYGTWNFQSIFWNSSLFTSHLYLIWFLSYEESFSNNYCNEVGRDFKLFECWQEWICTYPQIALKELSKCPHRNC